MDEASDPNEALASRALVSSALAAASDLPVQVQSPLADYRAVAERRLARWASSWAAIGWSVVSGY